MCIREAHRRPLPNITGTSSSARRPTSQEGKIEVLTEGLRRGEVRCRIVLKLCGDDVVPTNIILELAVQRVPSSARKKVLDSAGD